MQDLLDIKGRRIPSITDTWPMTWTGSAGRCIYMTVRKIGSCVGATSPQYTVNFARWHWNPANEGVR